jgi:hypothetical protein
VGFAPAKGLANRPVGQKLRHRISQIHNLPWAARVSDTLPVRRCAWLLRGQQQHPSRGWRDLVNLRRPYCLPLKQLFRLAEKPVHQ